MIVLSYVEHRFGANSDIKWSIFVAYQYIILSILFTIHYTLDKWGLFSVLWRKKLKDFNNLFFQQWYINIWDNRNTWGAKTLSLQRSFQFCVYSFSLLTAEHLFDLDIWWYFKEVYTSLFYFVLTFSGVSKILISRHINLSDFHHWDAPINWRIILEHTLID